MRPFENVRSVITPFDRVNVDTDQIVPKQFLKSVTKSGFGRYLFYDWRYEKSGRPQAGFVLNDPAYAGSHILVAGDNFGCGSSREHAVWALLDYGYMVIISTSFADIFEANCIKNGVLPISLSRDIVESLLGYTGEVGVDLERQEIDTRSGAIPFEITPHRKEALLGGIDEIERTFEYEEQISEHERGPRAPSAI